MLCCSLIFKSASAQINTPYDDALVPFMNYIRDDILQIGDWANGDKMNLELFSGYLPTKFDKELKNNGIPEFSKAESDSIYWALKNFNTYILNKAVLRKSMRNPNDSLAALFHKLFVNKIRLNRKIHNPIQTKTFQAEKINSDSLKAIGYIFKSVVQSNTENYNKVVNQINEKLLLTNYYYTFHPPIFLRNYSYCVLAYCNVPAFDFYISLYHKINGHWRFVRELCHFDKVKIVVD